MEFWCVLALEFFMGDCWAWVFTEYCWGVNSFTNFMRLVLVGKHGTLHNLAFLAMWKQFLRSTPNKTFSIIILDYAFFSTCSETIFRRLRQFRIWSFDNLSSQLFSTRTIKPFFRFILKYLKILIFYFIFDWWVIKILSILQTL